MAAVIGVTVIAALTGCGGGSTNKVPGQGELVAPPKASGGTNAGTVAAKRTTYPLKIKDATGKEFTFAKAPERIASVSPAETETLYALGLGDKVVGVSDFCDYPAEVKSKPKLGSIVKPNEEALIAANADLIMTGVSMPTPTVEKLRELKVNLFKVEPKTIDDIINNIKLMGQIFDRQEQAEKLAASMEADRKKVADAVKDVKPEQKKKVFIEISPGWTVGKGEFIDELITAAGGVNVASSEKGYVQLSEEKVIAANPQVILYPKNLVDDSSKKNMDQLIRARSGWNQIDAVKNNKLVGVDDNMMSRPGPRITAALVEFAKGIYPDLVK
ncbi:cobalamin-binding protein [Paenibacillus cremeus]|uniref:Cobalamin-binding protein n=1 Tax=Paenibacillus cremeus TaxID=2163881 RepID=A0A559K6E8_9BACL|nr:cobalamin-binding protein [Paenibacillus cremeus]